jgi:hypothetical protein
MLTKIKLPTSWRSVAHDVILYLGDIVILATFFLSVLFPFISVVQFFRGSPIDALVSLIIAVLFTHLNKEFSGR